MVSSKFFLNGENGEPDFVKYFEIQSSISKSMIGFYINSGDFTEMEEFYELGVKLFYFSKRDKNLKYKENEKEEPLNFNKLQKKQVEIF